jgi:glycosyltransferase involved in cell wall biosynthesis
LLDALAVKAVWRSCRHCLHRSRAIAVSSIDYAKGSEVLRGTEQKWVEIPPPDKGSASVPSTRTGLTMRIGFLGRFVEEKGLGILLEAAPLVLRRFPNAQFVLAGNFTGIAGGGEYGQLRHRIESLGESVQIPGYIPEDQLPAFYSSLDVFVLPSITSYEAFGMVQVEAMKAGVPVVATDMRGVRVPIQRTGNGILVPPREPSALADAIVQVLADPRLRCREDIARRAWSAFSSSSVIDRYTELYSVLFTKTGHPVSSCA